MKVDFQLASRSELDTNYLKNATLASPAVDILEQVCLGVYGFGCDIESGRNAWF